MSDEKRGEEELTFGEKLLGMQGFSAPAARYRAEMENLLVHRLTPYDRWVAGLLAVPMCVMLTACGMFGALAVSIVHPKDGWLDANPVFPVTIGCALAGLLFGGWLLKVAIQGGYARRLGDIMGLVVALLFCGGWAFCLLQLAWETSDEILRIKLLSADAVFLVLMTGCLLMTLLQPMHRQTQEKLLRIEYHLAELLERNAKSPSA